MVIDAMSHWDFTSSSNLYSLPRSPVPARFALMCWSTLESWTFVSSRSSPARRTVSPLHAFTWATVTTRLSFAAGGGAPGVGRPSGEMGRGGATGTQPMRSDRTGVVDVSGHGAEATATAAGWTGPDR